MEVGKLEGVLWRRALSSDNTAGAANGTRGVKILEGSFHADNDKDVEL
jgi:hypothetical protein